MDPVLTTPRPPSSTIRLLMLLTAYAVPLLGAVRARLDADLWWHLRAGQWIVTQRQVTTTDPFSQYGADKPWLAYSWLFEIAVYGLYEWLDVWGVVLFRGLLALTMTACIHWLIVRREPRFLVGTLLLAVALLPLIPLVSERPWFFTIIGSTLTLLAILDLRESRAGWAVWLLPLLFVLWANIHIQFIYGLMLLGLGCAAPLLDRLCRLPTSGAADTWNSPLWRRLVLLTVLCTLATLVNPYHLRLYFVVHEYATQATPFQLVEELKAMPFRAPGDWVVLALALGAAFVLGRKARLSSFEVVLLALGVFLGFRARRDVWMIVLALVVIVPGWGLQPGDVVERFVLTGPRLAVLAVGELLILLALALRPGFRDELAQAEEKQYPKQAVAVIQHHLDRGEVHGPIYNTFSWGGYLIWRLPDLPVSMDGRTNLHGEERLRRNYLVWNGNPDWRDSQREPELAAANLILLDRTSALTELLRLDRTHYGILHEDEQAVVFVRKAAAESK